MKKAFSMVLAAAMMLMCCVGCGKKTQGTGSVSAPQGDDKVYELRLGHIQPTEHPNGQGAEEFARLVEEKTNGKVKISVFPSSALGTEQELFDALALGAMDFAIIGFGEPAKQYSPFMILDAPYLAADREQWLRIMNSDVMTELCAEMEKVTNVSTLGVFYYGARYMTTSNLEVHGPADLKGHSIRTPDQKMYLETINAMGATATPMALSEVFLALQNHTIDGQENPLATIASNNFNEVQKYLIKTEHIMGGNCLYASSTVLESLPEEYRAAILEAGKEAAEFTNKVAFETEDSYLKKLQDSGMTLIEDVDKEAFQKATESVYDLLGSNWDADLLERIRAVQ